jgi:GNAT superfamily N-acetyltransferase
MNVTTTLADLDNGQHTTGLLAVIDSYAIEPAGGGKPLSADVRERLIDTLRDHPTTLIVLALCEESVVGAAVCFLGLSTFRARPLLNIHDLAVLPDWRGRGVGRMLLQAVEDQARQRGCCRLTLEVLDGNAGARRLYSSFGFVDFESADPEAMRFLSKPLNGTH